MTDDKVLKNAQYRKTMGIAWFNATNSAIEMVKAEQLMGMFDGRALKNEIESSKKLPKGKKEKVIKLIKVPSMEERLVYWRDKFLEEHKDYYAKVIAQIGQVYDAVKTIEILKSAKTKGELKLAWMALSEDERHDGEIRKVVKELKKTYEKS